MTKSVGVEEIDVLRGLGFDTFGENRVEAARSKIAFFGEAVSWHMIGHLQRRKAREVVALFSRVDSVDSVALGTELDKRCEAASRTMDVLLQVNASGEQSKGGFTPDALPEAVRAVQALGSLRVRGLMTMAPLADPESTRPVFTRVRELAEAADLPALSMGMSNDFEVAIEEGATEVRIGTMLYN